LLSVAAIVVSHAQAEKLTRSLQAIADQSHPLQQVVVVETANDPESIEIARSFGFAVVTNLDVRLGAAIQAGIDALAQTPGWLWILHEDTEAEPNALNAMAKAAEISPSVAVIGSKLLDANNPIQIQQMGLTTTRTGRPFLLVQKEYDQGQHDNAGDTLAVSTASMLVSMGVWQQLGGLDDQTPTLAQDLEFCAKARSAGYRVVVEPASRVKHHGLSMAAGRSRRWLGGTFSQAVSKAHLHMATLILPLPLVVLAYLAMPLFVLVSLPFHLLNKRPARIVGQLTGWLWAWFTVGKRLAARARFVRLGSSKPLAVLFAGRSQLRARRKSRFEAEPELAPHERLPGFFRSNSAWFTLLPLLASVQLFPQGALKSDQILPLGSSFKEIWDQTGVDTVPHLEGVNLPSDPINWLFSLIALASPADPSLGFATLVFLAPVIAFLGAWQLGKLVLKKPWVITLAALGYSLSPQLLTLKSELQLPELIASAILPWAAYFLVRSATGYNTARSWRWIGLAGLASALLAVTVPLLFALNTLVVLGLMIFKPRRALIMVWAPVPGLILLYPWISLGFDTSNFSLMTVASSLAAPASDVLSLTNLTVLGGLAAFSLVSWFVLHPLANLGLWGSALAALALAWFQPVSSSAPLVSAALLAFVMLAASGLQAISNRPIQFAGTLVAVALVGYSTVAIGFMQQNPVQWGDSRIMPALVVAASEQDPEVRSIVITPGETIGASYVWGSGRHLEDQSLALSFSNHNSELAVLVAETAGNLVAGNADRVSQLREQLDFEFVLLKGSDSQVAVAIDSIDFLQPAGITEFGSLWKVEGSVATGQSMQGSVTSRNYQLGVLAAYLLLAIPTRASIRGYRRVKAGVR
jgi:GT2 family glycosyltransferase